MKTMNISVPDGLGEFVEKKIESGTYTSASEVVREGLRLLKQRDDDRIAWLREAIREGLESGEPRPLSELSADRIAARAAARLP